MLLILFLHLFYTFFEVDEPTQSEYIRIVPLEFCVEFKSVEQIAPEGVPSFGLCVSKTSNGFESMVSLPMAGI